MKKIFLSKLFLISSAILLGVYGVISACGGGDEWDYFGYNSNFTPETFVDKSYRPLFLSDAIFYGIGTDIQYNSRFNKDIVNDWSVYLESKMDTTTVHYFLIGKETLNFESQKAKIENASEVKQLYSFLKTNKKNKASEKWTKKIDLSDVKVQSFITFLYFAQQVEKIATADDYWSYEPRVAKTFNDIKTIQAIESLYQNTTDSFLKNRYWFLTMKSYFYSATKQKAVSFFEKTSDLVPKNILYFRALSYVAGVHYQNKNYGLSNYLYSKVFDKCPQLRTVMAYNFHPQEDADWKQALALAKNSKEKAALWAIHGFYKDEKQAVEKIYSLDPKSEHLSYLLTRMVNKQERLINNSFIAENENQDDEDPYHPVIVKQTLVQNQAENATKLDVSGFDLVKKIADEQDTQQPYLWNIALGYLQSLKGEHDLAKSNFDKAERIMPKNKLAIDQLRLLRFVNTLSAINELTDKGINAVINDLKWLYVELPANLPAEEFRYINAVQWSKNYLAALYKAKNNQEMAELFEFQEYYSGNGNAFFDKKENLLKVKSILEKENKSEIEKLAVHIYPIRLKDINQFQAVEATYQNKIGEAIGYIIKSDSLQHSVFLGNPFNGTIKDCHDCDHQAKQIRKYTNLTFLQTIEKMQNNLSQNIDTYNNALLLGNAFYNITHFGNGRTFYEGPIRGYGSSPYSFRSSIRSEITNCQLAEKYYALALQAAYTKEQKAKCLFMLAKCQRNAYYNKKYKDVLSWWDIRQEKVNFIAWDAFKTLKSEYKDTNYYKEVIRECGFFREYVRQ